MILHLPKVLISLKLVKVLILLKLVKVVIQLLLLLVLLLKVSLKYFMGFIFPSKKKDTNPSLKLLMNYNPIEENILRNLRWKESSKTLVICYMEKQLLEFQIKERSEEHTSEL